MPYIQLKGFQYEQLAEAFGDAFPTRTDLSKFLLFKLSFNIEKLSGGNIDDIIISMIVKFETDGKIFELLEQAVKVKSGNAKLTKAQADLIPTAIPADIDHFNVCFIGEDSVLINRFDLRESLKKLVDLSPGGKRILVVDGPSVSGKTYSFEFISYIYQALGKFDVIWIDLTRETKPLEPIDIARRIVDRIGLPGSTIPDVGKEQDTRWIQSFCDRLEREMKDKRDVWWLVIDGFNKWKLSPLVNEMIHEIGRRIRLTLPGLRMILLGYHSQGTEILPPDIEKGVIRENIKMIDSNDLIYFFVRIYEERKKAVVIDDITDKVAEVLRAIDPNSPRRIELIGAEITRICKTI